MQTGGLALAWSSRLPPQSAAGCVVYIHMCVHMNVPKLEMVSSSSAPYITFIYLCMYVCTQEPRRVRYVHTYVPLRTPGVPCTPEDFGSSRCVYVNVYVCNRQQGLLGRLWYQNLRSWRKGNRSKKSRSCILGGWHLALSIQAGLLASLAGFIRTQQGGWLAGTKSP